MTAVRAIGDRRTNAQLVVDLALCDEGRVPSPQQHAAADYSTCLVFVPR